MQYAVIMAGGAGKRLWPLSRLARPKQLLPLVQGNSLISVSVERLKGLFDNENILVITNREYADQIAEALPQIPRANIIGEPIGRDTANAVALAAEVVAGRDDDATMAIFTADHVIRPVEIFADNVRTAIRTAEQNPDALLTFGVHPTWPHPGLGYIHCGAKVTDGIYKVLGFKEKPDHQTARRYVESGKYFWNSGMFVWKVSAIRNALNKFLPDSIAKLASVAPAVREGKDLAPLLNDVYPTLEKISIDYAVMEKSPNVMMVELQCEWLDIGSWPSLENIAGTDSSDNVVAAEKTAMIDSFRNIVVSEDRGHLLAVLGVDDCIIIHSADATLVCNRRESQRLKELVNYIAKNFNEHV